MPTRAEELPIFTLIQEVLIPAIQHANKEIPTTYIIADCSNNPETYNQSKVLTKKSDLYRELKDTFKPRAELVLNYEESGAVTFFPTMQFPTHAKIELTFDGQDVITRKGIENCLKKNERCSFFLDLVQKTLKVYRVFIQQNRQIIQQILSKNQYQSPMEVLKASLKNIPLRNSFLILLKEELKLQESDVERFLGKWEIEHE